MGKQKRWLVVGGTVLLFSSITLMPNFNKGISDQINIVHGAEESDGLTVFSGNGGLELLPNELLLHQNDNSLQTVTSNAGDRVKIENVDKHTRVTLKDVQAEDTVTAKFGEVGTYQGRKITAEVTMSDLRLHEGHKQPFELEENDAAMDFGPGFSSGTDRVANIARLSMQYRFFDAATHEPVNLDHAFITFTSLDGPVKGVSSGFEYVGYQGSGKIYTVENSIVKQIPDPLDSNQLVMAGQSQWPSNWPYDSSTGATFEVNGTELNFVYGMTRLFTNDVWYVPMFALSTVTMGAPEIAQPTLTTDAINNTVTAGHLVTYDLSQKVNTLQEDLMAKYGQWSEELHLPENAVYQNDQIVDSQGKVIPEEDYQVQYDDRAHLLRWQFTKKGISHLPFLGETYHFKASVKTSEQAVDQTELEADAVTKIDQQTKQTNTTSVLVNNKRQILVHHYMTDSTDQVAKDEWVTVGYGRPYMLSPLPEKPTGYTYNSSLDINTRGVVTEQNTEATFFYDPDPFNVHVRYLLEDGQLLDQLEVVGLYGDSYTTEASDYNDLYTVDTARLPANANGIVTEQPINVDYYYKPTTGQWISVGNQGNLLVRKDDQQRVRSVSQTYVSNTGYTVQYNMDAEQVAITVGNDGVSKDDQDHIFNFNSQYTYRTPKGEQLQFNIDAKGGVTVNRQISGETNRTSFDQSGKVTAETKDITGDGSSSQQNDTIDGLKSMVTGEQFKQILPGGYVIDADRKIDLNHVPLPAKSDKQQVPSAQTTGIKNGSTDSIIQSTPDKAAVTGLQLKENVTAQTSDIGQAKTQSSRTSQPLSVAKIGTEVDSMPVQPGEENSFNIGIPLITPTFANDENISPNNNMVEGTPPVEASEITAVKLSRNGKTLYQGNLTNQQEKNIYVSSDKEIEIDAGADHDGFYVDTFNGNKGMACTMGSGYEWAAVKNDLPEPKDSAISTSAAATSKKDSLGNHTPPAPMTSDISPATTENSHDSNGQTSSSDNLKRSNKSNISRPNLLAQLLPRTGQRRQIGLVVLGVVILTVSGVTYLKRRKRGND